MPTLVLLMALLPWTPPPAKNAQAEKMAVQVVDPFAEVQITDARKLKAAKIKTIGGIPVVPVPK